MSVQMSGRDVVIKQAKDQSRCQAETWSINRPRSVQATGRGNTAQVWWRSGTLLLAHWSGDTTLVWQQSGTLLLAYTGMATLGLV